ncbi:VCBS domain-containing protein [Vibrio sp. 10N]|nr:VCBS domain-containing protein [Vibrio sp. 10N]
MGGTHSEQLQFTVTGTNDAPKVTGQFTGALKEDLNVDSSGLMHVHGKVDVVDVDQAESHTLSEVVQGKFGVLDIDSNGHWHYQVDNSLPAIQQLASGNIITEQITIHTADQTPQLIEIVIGGTADSAVISGVDSGSVKEDLNVVNGSVKTSGDLSVIDSDQGQNHFLSQVLVGQFGTLTIEANGHWQYEANNQQTAIQELAKGTHLSETFTVSSVDGTAHNIDVQIDGTNDLPVMTVQSQSLKEDGAVFHGQMVATDTDHDLLTYTTSNPIDGLTFNPDGSYTFDPSHASYQHLAKGDTQVVTTMVSVTDTAGGTHREELKFTITGTNDLPVMAGQSQSVKEDGAVFQGQMVATDVDQDLLTYTTSNPIDGLTFNSDGSYTFDPSHSSFQHLAKGDTQVVTTMVTVTDTAGSTHREQLKFTITGTNDLPVMAGQSQSVKEDGAVFHGQMVATDVDKDLLTYTTSNLIDGLTFNPDGSYTFDPSHSSYQHLAKGDTQVVTTMVIVTDTAGGAHREQLKFTITGTNDLPVMAGQSQSVKEDGAVFHGQMVATDIDQDLLTYTTSNPIDGLTFNPDGSYTFDPSHSSYQHLAKGDTQVVTTMVSVTDTAGGTHREQLKFTITGTNDLPVMVGQSQSVKEDGAVFQGQMVATDIDHDLLTYTTSNPIDGLTFNPDGSYTFDPSHSSYQHLAKGDTQVLTTMVTVTDTAGGTHREELKFTITGTNDLPVMAGQSQSVKEDGAVFHGQMVATDIDQDLLTYTTSNPIDGLTFNPDGSYTFDPSHSSYQHLAKGDTQVVTTMVTVTDTAGGTHREQLEFTITGTNDLPMMAGQSQSVKEDGAVFQGQMVATDVEHDLLTYTTSNPIDGLTFNPDGSYTFDPSHSSYQHLAKGDTQVVTTMVTVTDTAGGSHREELKFTITGTNDLPMMAGQSQSVKEDGAVFHGQMVATDIDQDLLTYTTSNPIDGLTFNPDGSYTFDPSHSSYQHLAKGDTQVVTTKVTVTDTAGSTHREELKFTITGTNDLPMMAGQSQSVKEDGAVFHGQMVATDIDQDLLTYTTSNPIDGLTFNPDGSYTFDPSHSSYQHLAKGDTQVVTTKVTVTDTAGSTHREELKFTITGTNDLPVMTGQSQSVKEDGAVFQGQMVATDTDNDLLTYTTSNPIDGLTFNPDGSYTFDPSHSSYQHLAKGDTQVVTTMVTVTDTAGGSHREELKFTITGTNDLPMMAGQSQSVKEDGAVFQGQMVATDVDQDLLTYTTSNPIDGLTFNPDGSYTFDPSHSSYQHLAKGDTQVVTTMVTVTDTAGSTHREQLKFTITGTNDLPVMAGQSQSLNEDGVVFHGQMVATDVDRDLLTYTTSNPIDGLTFNPDGSYTFDPSHSSYQHLAKGDTQVLTTMVTVTDTAGGSHREQLKFTVTGTNDLPVMAGQSQSVKEDGAVFHGQMVATDTDHDLLTYTTSNPIDGLTFNPDGSYTFDPSHASYQHLAVGDTQTVKTTVIVTDTAGGQAQKELSFVIEGTNDKPSVMPITAQFHEDQSQHLDINLLSHAQDIDGDALSVGSLFQVKVNGHIERLPDGFGIVNGHLQVDPSSSTFQHLAQGEVATFELSYKVTDSHGALTPQSVIVKIVGTDDKAQLVSSSINIGEAAAEHTYHGTSIKGALQLTDIDTTDNPQFVDMIYQSSSRLGALALRADGHYEYFLQGNYVGTANAQKTVAALKPGESITETFNVKTADGQTKPVTVTIHGEEDSAQIVVNYGTTDNHLHEDSMTSPAYPTELFATGIVKAIDPDHDDDQLKPQTLVSTHGGHFTVTETGMWQYHIDNSLPTIQQLGKGESFQEQFTVESKDGSAQKVITVTVHGTNDDPEVSSTVTLPPGHEDKPYIISSAALLANASDVDANDAGHLSVASLVALKADGSSAGTITDNHNGSFTFTPELNYNGPVRFSYEVHDGHGGSAVTSASASLKPVSDNAQISYASTDHHLAGVTEDRGYIDTHDKLHFEGKLDIVDPDQGEAMFDINYGPQTYTGIGYDTKLGGHILLMRDGHYTYTIRDHQPQVQSLSQGEVLTDQCVVRAKDGTTFTIEVNIHGTNDAPTLSAQTQAVKEDGNSLNGQMQGRDIDHGATLTYSIAHAIDGLTFNADGSYTFDPSHASYQQLKDGEHKIIDIPVTVTDEHGASSTQNLTINVQGTGDAAVIGGVDTGDVYENQAGQDKSPDYAQPGIGVIGQDSLTTSGQLTIVDPDSGESVFDPNGQVYSYSGQYGHLLLRPDGHWEYAVAAGTHDWHLGSTKTTVGSTIDQLGQGETLTDTVTVHSKDGTTHDIVITIHGDNDAPYVSSEVTLQSGKEDVSQTFTKADLLANAVDVDSNDAGRLTVANLLADHGSVRDNHDGTYTFTPDRDYNGQVHFAYDVKDDHGGITPTGASMQITPVADAAQITAVGDRLKEDNVLSGTTELHSTGHFHVVDPDGAQESFFETTLAGRNAFYKGSLGGDLQVNKDGGYFYNIDNSLVDSLKNGETVTDQFTIRSADGTTKQVEFTIQGTSDKPYIGSGSLHECVFEDGGLLKGSLYGVDPDHGDQKHLVYTPVGSVPGFTMLPDGHYTFDSSHPAYQHASLSKGDEHIIIPVKVTDSEGLYSVQNLRITMIPTNDAPIVTGALSLSKGTEDQSVLLHSRDLLSNATDIDDYDRLHIANVRADHGRVIDNHDGTFTFIPDANYSGRVNFSYQVTDNHGASTPATATMDLANVNDPAVFSGQDTGGITEDHHVQGDAQHTVFTTGVLNVVDPDSGEQHFHATHRAQAIHDPYGGTLTIGKAGDWAYSVPNANLQHLAQGQTEQVQYQVQSVGGDTHTITVTIHGTNDAPTLTAQTQAVTEDGQELAGKMQGNDIDQGAVLHYAIAQAVDGLRFNNDGTYRFDPGHSAYQHLSAGQTQTLTIPVTVTDEHHASVTENLIITITGTNDNPIVSPISDTVKEDSDSHHVVDLLQGATDPDGGTLAISHIQCQYHGAAGPLPDGVTFSHDGTHVIVDATAQGFQHLSEGEKEQITFHYLVTDSQGGTTSQTATITVVGSDDKANIASSSIELTEQQALKTYQDISSFMGRLSLVDPDSHDHTQFSFTLEQGSQNIGYLTVWPDGTYRYYADAARNHGSNYRIAALKTGETLTEHFQVKTSDGQTKDIAVTIHGSDNNAYLEVVDPRYLPAHQNIYEDRTSHSDPNQLYAGGIIRVRDPDHDDAFAVSHSETTPHGGHFFVNNGGSWSYTIDNHLDEVQNLAEGESFTESFTITSKDGTASKVVQVTVHGSNDRPVVTAAVTLPSGEEDKDMILTSQQLLANATDRDHGDLARLSIANLSADHGVIIDHHDGTFTFRPNADYNGDVHFSYDVVDPHGASVHTSATSTLASVNDPSTLTAGLAHGLVTEDHLSGAGSNRLWSGWTNIDIQDPDGATDAAVVAIEVNGVRHNVPADFAMTLTANHGYFSTTHSTDGHNKWSYTADNANPDIQGLKSGEQLQDSMVLITRDGTRIPVTATINGQDDHVAIDTPNALTSPIGTVIEDSKATVAGMLHAHDLDYGDTVSYELANSQPTQTGSYGTFYLDSSGAWHYDLDASKVQALGAGDGKAEGFDIVAISSDGSRATQRVEVFVQGTDDAATITGQSTGAITEDQQVHQDAAHTVCVSGVLNAQDVDAGESGFQHTLNAHAINDPFGGSLSIGKTGGWTYSAPNANLQHLGQGETQQVQYEVQTLGGDKHIITIQVLGTNDVPQVSSEVHIHSGTEDIAQIISATELLANVVDVDQNDIGHLKVVNLHADNGSIQDNHDGTYTFTPDKDYNGTVRFSYDVTDTHGTPTHTGAVLTLASVDDKTEFTGSNYGVAREDVSTSTMFHNRILDSVDWQNLLITDADNTIRQVKVEFAGHQHIWTLGQDLDVHTPYGTFQFHTILSGPHKGEYAWSYIGDNRNSVVQGLKTGESLHESIKLIAQDGTEFPIRVEVKGTEDHVVIDSHSELGRVTENLALGASVSGQLVAHDTDTHDRVHWSATPSTGVVGRYGTFHVDAAGHWHYDVDQSLATQLGAGDERWEYFDVEAVSSDGSRVTKKVAVVVQGHNDNPTVSSDVVLSSGKEDTGIQLSQADLLANASNVDINDRGWLRVSNLSADHGQITKNLDGTYTFTPESDYNGVVQFNYSVIDRHGGSTAAHASVSLQAINDAPVLHVSPTTPITGTLTETDVDVGDTHQFGVSQSSGQYGTLSVDPDTGAYQYTPNGQIVGMHYNSVSGYTGQDTFEVSVTDKAGLTSSLFITFDVTGTVAAPSGTGQRPTTSTLVATQPTISQTMPTQMTASAQAINHVTVDLTTSSDTGQSDTDNLTSAQTPEISGHTDIPFSLVKIYDGSKVIGSGYSDDHGDYQIVVGALGDGVHNISARALAPSGVLPTVSSVMPVTIDTQAPTPSISIDSITSDNVINAVESQSSITITGSSTGGTQPGDVVTIEVGGHQFTGQLDASGRYSIDVPGGELVHTAMIKASVSATDSAGNTATVSADHHFDVDTSVSRPTITFEDPGPDNAYSKAEIAQGAAGTITATVHAAADAKVGEHININGVDHVLDANGLRHGIQLEVAPSTIVRAVMTDEHGNVSSSLNMAAGAKPEPIVVTAPSGSHQISASLGVPTLMPSQVPVPSAQQGWKILVNGHYHTSYTSQWGTLTIDPKTGHLSYQEHADVHTGPHGSAQNVGVHEDHFQIALQGSHQDDVLLHVQVSILSHGPGHSGKLTLGSEVLDMTVTPVISHAPSATLHDAYDVPEPDAVSGIEHELTIMTELGIPLLDSAEEESVSKLTGGASSYLEQLGIDQSEAYADGVNSTLPDDIDIVLNDAEQSDVTYEYGEEDATHHDEHSGIEHLQETEREHHDLDDPTLPDDTNH